MSQAVGIDLGTTNSAIARLDAHGQPVVMPNVEGNSITPSVICFRDGEILVGDTAKEMQALGTWPVAAFFKRQMGDPLFLFHADGTDYTAADLSAVLLRKLKSDAEAHVNERITHAVITVPAY
ncbi:Hsp70 family protein, partial [bacterium]|nr:Hsp70 family protein [bacterium]